MLRAKICLFVALPTFDTAVLQVVEEVDDEEDDEEEGGEEEEEEEVGA